MAIMGYLQHRLAEGDNASLNLHSKIIVKRGDEILEGPYPKGFLEFVGQKQAVLQLLTAVTAAVTIGQPMDHVLLASGYPGIGKTALGRLTAHYLDVGFVELGGKVKDIDAAKAIREMVDGDVLFLDEVHRMVAGGKAGAEWLLTLLQDGLLQLPTGVVRAPKITVIAATTDKEKLPRTMLDRFRIQPVLENYTTAEAIKIGTLTAQRLGFGGEHLPLPTSTVWLEKVARASDNNPRRIASLLATVRDVAVTNKDEHGNPIILNEEGYDLSTPLEWAGVTQDGLTDVMQGYLTALFAYGGTAGVATLKAALNLSDLKHTEDALIQRGYIVVVSAGRRLTEYGAERAEQVARGQLAVAQHREAESAALINPTPQENA